MRCVPEVGVVSEHVEEHDSVGVGRGAEAVVAADDGLVHIMDRSGHAAAARGVDELRTWQGRRTHPRGTATSGVVS